MDIGKIGLWTFALDLVPSAQAQDHAREIEELGFGTLWIPEALGREPFTSAGILLAGTRDLTVATGITSIWGRDAMTMAAGQKTLAEAYPGRFLVGMGVSHQPMVDYVRGHHYDKPYSAMKAYLDAMDKAIFLAPAPSEEPERVIAALGPKMLELAAERTAGAHSYFVPVEHTAFARSVMGPEPLLAVEQALVLETDPVAARDIARAHMAIYLGLPNNTNNLKRFGFDDGDIADGGSDRLVDAIVAWGDLDAARARVLEHLDAGADHVCVQVLPADATAVPLDEWRRLAPALLTGS